MYTPKNFYKTDYNGIMRGLVIDNTDPKLEGRVAVMIPKLMFGYTEMQPVQLPHTEAPLSPGMIRNVADNKFFNKIQQVNYYWARNCEMMDTAPSGYWVMNGKGKRKPDATDTHQLVITGAESHYIPNGGSIRVPRIGTYVYIMFEDGDPQKCYYLPFGPTQQGEAIPMTALEPESAGYKSDVTHRQDIHVIREFSNGNIMYFDQNHDINTFLTKFYIDPKTGDEVDPKIKMRYCDSGNYTQILTRTHHELMMFDCEKYCQMQTHLKNTTRWDDKFHYIETYTTNMHIFRMDDANKFCKLLTTDGHETRWDDAGKYIQTHTIAGITERMDDNDDTYTMFTVGQSLIKMTAGSLICIKCPGDITIKAGGTVNVIAGSAINCQAPTITLDGVTTVTKTLTVNGASTLAGGFSSPSGSMGDATSGAQAAGASLAGGRAGGGGLI